MSQKVPGNVRRARKRRALEQRQSEVFGRLLRGETTELSVEELPLVDRALECALPLFGYSAEWPEWPQAQGTCVAMEYKGVSFLLATKHEIDGAPDDGVFAPLFSGPFVIQTGEGLAKPSGYTWLNSDDPDDPDRFDLVLMPFEQRPRWAEEVRPLRLDTIARSAHFKTKALFALAGYPRTGPMMNMNYDAGSLRRDRFVTIGTYVGPTSWSGCHTLACDTTPAGGADGLSGCPVFRVTYDDEVRVEWGFAGIAVRGGEHALHFIDAIHVMQLIGATESRLGWPPRLGTQTYGERSQA